MQIYIAFNKIEKHGCHNMCNPKTEIKKAVKQR